MNMNLLDLSAQSFTTAGNYVMPYTRVIYMQHDISASIRDAISRGYFRFVHLEVILQ